LRERHADGVAVVLADEDDGELVHAREVHRLVRAALRGRAVSEVADRDRVFAFDSRGIRGAHRMREVRADLARDAADAEAVAREVRRELATAAVWVVRPGERAQEELVGRDTERESDA